MKMAETTGTMKGRVSSLWANPIEIDSWITGEKLNKGKIPRGAGFQPLVLFGD